MRDLTKYPGHRKGRTCAVCDAAVGDRGPDSASGRYFCPRNDCRRVRNAERQQLRREEQQKIMEKYKEKRKLDPSLPETPPQLSRKEQVRRSLLGSGIDVDELFEG